jgi:hypothetical protein
MMPRPQFHLRSLFILTAIVAVGCWAALSWGRIIIVGLLGLPYLVAGFAYLGVRLFRKLAPPSRHRALFFHTIWPRYNGGMAKPFQFRLRTLLLAVVPVALITLPHGWYVRRPVPPRTIPVSGIVTLDGQPLEFATVIFFPVDPNGRAALGVTDSIGRFWSQTHIGGRNKHKLVSGALPGFYRVTLERSGRVDDWYPPKPPADVPEKYTDVDTSGMGVEVTVGGPNVFALSLTTP